MTRAELISQVAGHLHADQLIDGAKLVAEFSGQNPKLVADRNSGLEFCNSLFYWCLNNDDYVSAAKLLWTPTLFNPEPYATKAVWDEIQKSNSLLLMGAASMSKSYGCGVWLLLDWVRDPEFTSVNLVGPSEDHLKDNLFTHLVTLHSQSALPLPGVVGDLFLGLDPKKRKGAIRGIVIPLGKRPAGRLQGRKRVPRKAPHPKLGTLSRIRFMLDELEKVPIGVWKDVDNVFANLDSDIDGFKIIGAFNPENPDGQVALRCEPEKGWEAFDAESDERWTSKRGWRVLRLDAAKCENVVEKKVIYPGLQTYEGFQRIIKNSGGANSPGYWTMARACFPREGAVYSVIPQMLVYKLKGEFMFAEEPTNFGAADLALEGNDTAEFAAGRFGRATGYRTPPTFDHPNGRELLFTDKHGNRVLRYGLQVDQLFSLPKGDTVKMSERLKEECTRLKIRPEHLMLDRTGNGAGVHDLLKSLWSHEVRGVNYTEAATERKILEEDTKTAKEEYERVVSELWFALKKWCEFDFVRVHPDALGEELSRELSGRRYSTARLTRVESKDDYKSRGNPSPNKADALTLLLHGVRAATGIIPSATEDLQGVVNSAGSARGEVFSRTGESDRFDDLDSDPVEDAWLT